MATTTVTSTVEEKKRLVRRLAAGGRGFAEEYGIRVSQNPASLFQVLVLALLLTRDDAQRAVRATRALRDAGWDTAGRMAHSRPEQRDRVLREHGLSAPDAVAALLGELSGALIARYRGDLRRLRAAADRDPGRIRQLLTRLPGVDDQVVELFLRDVQVLWREVAPVADRRALAAARRLGLGRTAAELAELAGNRRSERLAWLVGALARIDLENRYAELR